MSLQAASNFLTTPFPQEEEVYGATFNTTTGEIGSGFTAKVVVHQVVAGSIGGQLSGAANIPHQTSTGEIGSASSGKVVTHDLVNGAIGDSLSGAVKNNQKVLGEIGSATSRKVVTHDLVSGEIGDTLSGVAITKYAAALSANISASGFSLTNKTVIGLTEDADVVVHSQGVGANDTTEWADAVEFPSQDVLTEYALTIFPFVDHFYSQMSASIAASEATTIPHQTVTGEIGDNTSGKAITATLVKGEIGDAFSKVTTISQSVKGEIGDTLHETLVTHDLVSGEIGSSDSGRAQTGDYDTFAEPRIRLSATVVISQKAKGSIGNALSGAVVTAQKVFAYISSSLFAENQEVISQVVKGEIGDSFTQKETTTTSATGEIGDSTSGKVITTDKVSGEIGDSLSSQTKVTYQTAVGEIGDTLTERVLVSQKAAGEIGSQLSETVILSQLTSGHINGSLSVTNEISQTASGEIGASAEEKVITSDIVSGEIGSGESGKAQSGTFEAAASSRIRISATTIVSAITSGEIGAEATEKVITNDIVNGEIDSSASGAFRVSQYTLGRIGARAVGTTAIETQKVQVYLSGSIGGISSINHQESNGRINSTSIGITSVLTQIAQGSIGVRPIPTVRVFTIRVPFVPITVKILTTKGKIKVRFYGTKAIVKTFSKKVKLRISPEEGGDRLP